MKLNKKDFNEWKNKSITLLGMSGALSTFQVISPLKT